MKAGWSQHGAVRAREVEGGLDIEVEGLTTQAKYYKPLIREFFRKAWPGDAALPPDRAWTAAHQTAPTAEFSVEIVMEYVGEAPWLDLDNLAKALLDAIKGYAFADDAQVGRLLVERASGQQERITIRIRRR